MSFSSLLGLVLLMSQTLCVLVKERNYYDNNNKVFFSINCNIGFLAKQCSVWLRHMDEDDEKCRWCNFTVKQLNISIFEESQRIHGTALQSTNMKSSHIMRESNYGKQQQGWDLIRIKMRAADAKITTEAWGWRGAAMQKRSGQDDGITARVSAPRMETKQRNV